MLHAHHTQLHPLELCGRRRPTSSFPSEGCFFIVGHKEIAIDVRIFLRRNIRRGGQFGSKCRDLIGCKNVNFPVRIIIRIQIDYHYCINEQSTNFTH
jgi:hypothetical protein